VVLPARCEDSMPLPTRAFACVRRGERVSYVARLRVLCCVFAKRGFAKVARRGHAATLFRNRVLLTSERGVLVSVQTL
jgi:hypothetical protein